MFTIFFVAEEMLIDHVQRGFINGGVIIQPCTIFGRFNERGWGELFKVMYQSKGNMPGLAGASSFVDVQDLALVFVNAATSGDGKKCEKYVVGGTNDTALNMQNMIGELVGYPGPANSVPTVVLKFLSKWNEWCLHIPCFRVLRIKKKVIGSPLMVSKLLQNQSTDSLKAIKILNYKPRPLKDILYRNYDWILKEGLLET